MRWKQRLRCPHDLPSTSPGQLLGRPPLALEAVTRLAPRPKVGVIRASKCGVAAVATRASVFTERTGPAMLPRLSAVVRGRPVPAARDNARWLSTGASRWSDMSSAKEKKQMDKDFIVSVLEASPTKRDAKGYLQKYNRLLKPSDSAAPKRSSSSAPDAHLPAPLSRGPGFVQGPEPKPQRQQEGQTQQPRYVALVKFRLPQMVDDRTLDGVAKTLSQLRALGLLSIVVVDCGGGGGEKLPDSRELAREQSWRIAYAISKYESPGATTLDRLIQKKERTGVDGRGSEGYLAVDAVVAYPDAMESALRRGCIPIIPAILDSGEAVDPSAQSREVILALVRYFSGLQSLASGSHDEAHAETPSPRPIASVERVIVLDPLGGIPAEDHPGSWHRFINLAQEYDHIVENLKAVHGRGAGKADAGALSSHAENLTLARDALLFLPSTSSAIITTPLAAANIHGTPPVEEVRKPQPPTPIPGFIGTVKTRSVQNPLIHNLLTDKPVYSSSLPLMDARVGEAEAQASLRGNSLATLIKRGMPLTIFPDPLAGPWLPPQPGSPRLRLTDTCIDLPRLVYLIDDSFGRKLDVQHYLNRVNENLAGIIIAGEYEGGAILTWERPFGLDNGASASAGRTVPYLDKFAVLKSRQGSGGVADIVFNAMTRDCFPGGVCWRSRVDNPVNRWYFERSAGTLRLRDGKWTMFWTTPELGYEKFLDYEDVCAGVVPSWADNKHIVD